MIDPKKFIIEKLGIGRIYVIFYGTILEFFRLYDLYVFSQPDLNTITCLKTHNYETLYLVDLSLPIAA